MVDTTPTSFSPTAVSTATVKRCEEFEHLYQPIGTPYSSVKADTAWHCMICGAMLGHVAADKVSEKVVEVQQATDYDYSC